MKLYWGEAMAMLTLGKVAMMSYVWVSQHLDIFSFNNQNRK